MRGDPGTTLHPDSVRPASGDSSGRRDRVTSRPQKDSPKSRSGAEQRLFARFKGANIHAKRTCEVLGSAQSRPKTVAVLVYGLIRSDPMLRWTAPSLINSIVAPFGGSAAVFVHGYCFRDTCDPALARAEFPRRCGVKALSIAVEPPHYSGRKTNCSGYDPQREADRAKEAAGMLSLLAAFRLAERHPHSDTLRHWLISRIDVLYMPWRVELPTPAAATLLVPSWHNNGGLNDRWAYGTRQAIKVYFMKRLSLMVELDFCWQWAAERAACLAARRANLTVVPFDVRFVRLRANLFVPDLDLATVAHEIPPRFWMVHHRSMCRGNWFRQMEHKGLTVAEQQWAARVHAKSR